MGNGERDGIFMGGMGSDIYGEDGTGRVVKADRVNAYLRTTFMKDYL